MNTKLLLPLAAAILAGCTTVGPDYKVPDDAAVNRAEAQAPFSGAADNAAVVQAPLPDRWWRLYADPALNGQIEKALGANTDLRVAAANLERAQAAVQESQALRQPSVGVNASPTFGHVSGIQELAPDVRPKDQWSYSAGVSVSYQVDLVGQIRRAIEASAGDAQAAQAAYDLVRVNVAAETARAYTEACSAGLQLASARHSVAIQNESLNVTSRLLGAGRGTALDVTRARSQLQQLQADLPTFEGRRRTALYRLATLTGETPNNFPKALLNCEVAPQLTQPIPVGDGAALLRRRPDIRRAERSLAAATARIGVAVGDLYPKISLGLSGASGGPASLIGDRGTFGWSVGPLISWTIPNTGAVQARIAEARASTKAAVATFDGVVLTALRETETALTLYARQLDRDQDLRNAHEQSAEAARQARALFQAGKTDYLTVLDANRTLANTDSALAASQAQVSEDQIALFLALGGGWEQGSGK
jgi:NodT family efflux transporter outer membrane factor (OMF) lipoprotein